MSKKNKPNIPANNKPKSVTLAAAFYEGPLPPANELERYENIHPGAADRIITMAEKEQSHRHECDDKFLSSETHCRKAGLWLGSVILVLGMTFSYFLIQSGKVWLGGIFGAATFLTLIPAIISGGRQIKKDEPRENQPNNRH